MLKWIAPMMLVLALGLVACGDDDDEATTVTETATTGAEGTGTTEAGSGPAGELTTTGIGEVQQGMRTEEVQELFGAPDQEQTGPGCELAPQAKGALAWTYKLDDGEVILNFDAGSGELGFYRVTSPSLETTLGDKVGDTYATLKENWGSDLEPLPLGTGPTPKAGFWVVKDEEDPRSALNFDIRGGKIAGILGGHIEVCE
jgi:hypothetical protein